MNLTAKAFNNNWTVFVITPILQELFYNDLKDRKCGFILKNSQIAYQWKLNFGGLLSAQHFDNLDYETEYHHYHMQSFIGLNVIFNLLIT